MSCRCWLLTTLFIVVYFISLPAIDLGVVGGPNMANFIGKDIVWAEEEDLYVDSFWGAHVGFFAEIPLTRAISIRGEIAGTTEGSNFKVRPDQHYSYDELKHRIVMLQVPISVIYTLDIHNFAFNPTIGGGFTAGYPAYSHYYERDGHDHDDGDYGVDTPIDLKPPYIGYQLSLGVARGKFSIELRHNRSISPVFKAHYNIDDHEYYAEAWDDMFFSSWKALLGYRF